MSPCSAFQSTLSVRRATFTPTLDLAVSIFQSTLSVRRATHDGHSTVGGSIFQSTLSVRRATPEHPEGHARNMISIHALRKESDRLWNHHASHHQRFQSTLSVRRATGSPYFAIVQFVFQSTLSVRRATGLVVGAFVGDGISIHALRKESDQAADHVGHQLHISIHALRKESDACRLAGNGSVLISIHALRKESDIQARESAITAYEFQSTLSVRRATCLCQLLPVRLLISIHALP